MRPLLVLSAGRSGSTYLMRLLASHPQVIAHERYPLEFRPFGAAVFPAEAQPAEIQQPHWAFEGADELLCRPLEERGFITIDEAHAIYRQLASIAGKSPKLFAEKLHPARDAKRVIEIDPKARFIFLVRDPRDTLLSARDFDRKRGHRGFVEQDGDTDELVVLKYRYLFGWLIANAEATGAMVVRYEDLATSSEVTVSAILRALDLDADTAIVTQSILTANSSEDGEHTTSPTLAASVGRWQSQLTDGLRDLYRTNLGDVLRRFGYPV